METAPRRSANSRLDVPKISLPPRGRGTTVVVEGACVGFSLRLPYHTRSPSVALRQLPPGWSLFIQKCDEVVDGIRRRRYGISTKSRMESAVRQHGIIPQECMKTTPRRPVSLPLRERGKEKNALRLSRMSGFVSPHLFP